MINKRIDMSHDGPLWVPRKEAKKVLNLTEEEFDAKVKTGEILFERPQLCVPSTLYCLYDMEVKSYG